MQNIKKIYSASVLIIDTNTKRKALMAEVLTTMKHTVILVNNLKDALHNIISVKPDLVLIDISDGQNDCFELLDFIKYDSEFNNIPAIVISDIDDAENIERCIEAGATDYLIHPIKTPFLRARINFILESKSLRDKENSYIAQIELYLDEVKEKGVQIQNLLRVVTHDIANPLTIIQGNIQILLSSLKKGKELALNKFEKIQRASRSIADILEHVRQMQALESGKLMIKLEEVNINDVMKDELFIFKDKLEQKKLELILEDSGLDNLRIMAEKVSFTNQVLSNIISNAIKFSAENGKIIVSAKGSDVNNVVLKIEDNGIGIPKKLLKDIFMPNKKTTRIGTSGEVGTGFGMPLVKSYIEKYGGKIEVKSKTIDESPDDHGTAIFLTLKRAA